MNKKIILSGKHNIELIEGKKDCKRINNILPTIDKKYLERKGQIEIINCLYLNQDFKDITIIKTELNRKIKGYQQQDKEKKIYNRARKRRSGLLGAVGALESAARASLAPPQPP